MKNASVLTQLEPRALSYCVQCLGTKDNDRDLSFSRTWLEGLLLCDVV
jgi:hypothetical protein